MGLLQQDEAVFYHPLDDTTEVLKSQAWTLSPGSLAGGGKISNAMSGTGGDSVTLGAASEFVGTGTGADNISTAALSTSKSVVAYRDATGERGAARVATVSGTTVTLGAETEFNSASSFTNSVIVVLSATKFVVVYRNAAVSLHGTAKVGTVSGTDITFGAATEFLSTGHAGGPSATALSATKFVVAYEDRPNSTHGTAKVGTVSGTDITFGAKTEFLSDTTFSITVVALSATKFVATYVDNADSNHGKSKVGTVSGTDITFGAEAEFSAGSTGVPVTAALSATKFVVAYQDNADSAHGTAKVGTVSGTNITFGAESEFASDTTIQISVSALDSSIILPAGATTFVVAYSVLISAVWQSEVKVGTVAGTDITFGAATAFIASDMSQATSVGALSATNFLIAYSDIGDSNFGKAKAGALTGSASLTASAPAAYTTTAAATKLAFCGWLKNPSA